MTQSRKKESKINEDGKTVFRNIKRTFADVGNTLAGVSSARGFATA